MTGDDFTEDYEEVPDDLEVPDGNLAVKLNSIVPVVMAAFIIFVVILVCGAATVGLVISIVRESLA